MGGIFCAASFLSITASDISDQLLKDFLDMDSSQIVTMHIQSVDQNRAIKTVKRTITELVKTTVYDAVVPFLPQAPVWGSLTGVRPAKLARGMIERGMTRGEGGRAARALSRFARAHGADDSCSRNCDGDGQDHR